MTKITNLTPHEVNLVLEGNVINFPSKGVIRVQTESKQIGSVCWNSSF